MRSIRTPRRRPAHRPYRPGLPLPAVRRALLVFLLGAGLSAAASAGPGCPADERWGLVIDAGSSGSRLRLYCWKRGEGEALPSIEDRGSRKVEPGIADAGCRRTPGEAVELLRPLVDHARATIGDEARWAETPLAVLATGGLRRCSEGYRSRMLEGIRGYLAGTPFAPAEARLISGEDEGRYGWAAVNYLLGLLRPEHSAATVGALDLGGASTQITFLPADCPAERGECGELELAGAVFPLYTRSYLGWGQDEAMRSVDARACYLRGYRPADGRFVGRGRYARCRRAIRRTIRRRIEADPPAPGCSTSCNLLGAYQPAVRGDFVAFSAYAYNAESLGLEPTFSLADLEAAGKAYCKTPWQAIQAQCAAGERSGCEERWLNRNCFASAYMVTLLHEVYGFPMEGRRITATNHLAGFEIDWTLGAMLSMAVDLSASTGR
jgi:apyrase